MTTSGGGTCAVRVVKYKVARVSLSSPVTGAWLAHAVCVSSRLYPRGFFLLSVCLLLLSRPCVCVFLLARELTSELWHWEKQTNHK